MCTLITSKGTEIDESIANQNHAIPVHVHRNRGILTSLVSENYGHANIREIRRVAHLYSI